MSQEAQGNSDYLTRITWTDRWLLSNGVSPSIYKTLFKTYLTLDFRSEFFGRSTNTGPQSIVSPLIWVLGLNLIIGLIVSFVMFARVDLFFFTLVALTISVIVSVSSVVVEFREIVVDPDDMEIIGHLPIPSKTYAAARLTNLGCYTLLTILSVNFFPMVVGIGFRDADWLFPFRYALSALSIDLLAVAIAIFGYVTVWQRRDLKFIQEGLAWTQCGLVLILFYGGQFLLRDSQQSLQLIAYQLPTEWKWFPLSWLAGSIASPPTGFMIFPSWSISGWLFAAFASWWLLFHLVNRCYAFLQNGGHQRTIENYAPLRTPGQLGGFLTTTLIRDAETRSIFWLAKTLTDRDLNLRLRCWSTFSLAVAPLIIGLLRGELKDPYQGDLSSATLSIVSIYLIGFSVPSLINSLQHTRDFRSAWILESLPFRGFAPIHEGILLLIWTRFLVPVAFCFWLAFSWRWSDWSAAAIHVAAGLLGALISSYISLMTLPRRLPFSLPTTNSELTSSLALALGISAGTLSLLSGFHYFAAANQIHPILILLVLATLVMVVRWVALSLANRISQQRDDERNTVDKADPDIHGVIN